MNQKPEQVRFTRVERDAGDWSAEKEDALELSVLGLLLVVSVVGVGLLATIVT